MRKIFIVEHKMVGDYHQYYVPKSDLDAAGAGLIVSSKDPDKALRAFARAMETAKRFQKIPQDADWVLAS